MEGIVAEKPKLLSKGRVFVSENDCAGAMNHVRHTHTAFNNFSTMVMKSLLGDSALQQLLTKNDEPAMVCTLLVGSFATALWATFPTSLTHFARLIYASSQKENTGDWSAFVAKLPVKLSDAGKVWDSKIILENFLQLRTKYMLGMLEILLEHLRQLRTENKDNDLGEAIDRVLPCLENATKFVSTCIVDVSSAECQVDDIEAWRCFWCKTLADGNEIMNSHCKAKTESDWQKRVLYHKAATQRLKVPELKKKYLEMQPLANLDTLGKDALAELVVKEITEGEKEVEKDLITKFEKRRAAALQGLSNSAEVDEGTMALIAGAIASTNLPAGSLAQLSSGQSGKVWKAHAIAGLAQSALAMRYGKDIQDVGTSSLRYKVPKAGVEKPTSKLWTDQTCKELRLFLVGRVVTAPCSLATGSKLVRSAGEVAVEEELLKFFIMPTASMMNPLAGDSVPGWMVRPLKLLDDGSFKQAPTMVPVTEEFEVKGNLDIQDFKIQTTCLVLSEAVSLSPSTANEPAAILELTRAPFEEEARPEKRKRDELDGFDEEQAKFLEEVKKMAKHVLT